MDAMKHFTEGMIKENKPQFEVGDTVRVSVRIKEGDKERVQAFEGTVIAKKHGGAPVWQCRVLRTHLYNKAGADFA